MRSLLIVALVLCAAGCRAEDDAAVEQPADTLPPPLSQPAVGQHPADSTAVPDTLPPGTRAR